MGELQQESPMLRIWAGENADTELDNLAVLIYRDRLPIGSSFKEVRKSILGEIEKIVRNSPYSYWVSPKARWMME
ncbi:unnamed protein product [marine sediment metagenome]|uniref:Uncharacterized protein n=1 Tax=marine sediment metagenome TaxID=412755 RepID=X1HA64_9ZZZZ